MIFCGIDIGTTNTKSVLLGTDGRLLGRLCIKSKTHKSSANEWYNNFEQVLEHFASKGHFINKKIICSITAQGGSFALLDKNLKPIGKAHSWTDPTEDNIAQKLIKSIGKKIFYHITGCPPNGWLVACKLNKMAGNNSSLRKARYITTVPDFIYSQLTGKLITDITNAQITGLCDFKKAKWNEQTLRWASIEKEMLPPIASKLEMIFENVSTPWGEISFATSSHDQYAAIQAAGLEKDKGIMLGTGTAWVINGRSSKPVFDDKQFMTYAGRDLRKNCFGYILIAGSIGQGFDKLLKMLKINKQKLVKIQKTFQNHDAPDKVLNINLSKKLLQTDPDTKTAIKNYMEWGASTVAFAMERFGLKNINHIVMTGGATASPFWPQVIANVCNITVEAIDFSEFTAYGAALHAIEAVKGKNSCRHLKRPATSRIYEPINTTKHRQWYLTYQKPILEKSLI